MRRIIASCRQPIRIQASGGVFWRFDYRFLAAERIFSRSEFCQSGISGQITGEMLGRLKADVIDLRPSVVVILAGTNDLARGIPLTGIEDNLLMIADLCDTYKIKVVFGSVLPVSDYHKADNKSYERTTARPPIFINALNEWIQTFCANRHHVIWTITPRWWIRRAS